MRQVSKGRGPSVVSKSAGYKRVRRRKEKKKEEEERRQKGEERAR